PLSTRTRSGSPQRAKTWRNISWISCTGTCSQRRWGGNLGGQDGPRDLIGDPQPADPLATGQGDILDGGDLPDLVGVDGLGDRRGSHAAAPRSLDSGPYEGGLETADRGDWAPGCVLAELKSNQAGAPARVLPLERAGELEQLLSLRGDRATTGAIVGSQAL